jgi:hypothetical protein
VWTPYDAAVKALYQTPHESFVTQRQRLAAELKGAGDKASAARLSKLARPSLSAWAVNQLWWHAPSAFDDLFTTAKQVRSGKRAASSAHREVISKLTARAKQLLETNEHSGNDATLRRISMTLSALAAAGGFEPEQPGMLSKDLDPPGFEAFGIGVASEPEPVSEPKHEPAAKKETGKAEDAETKRHEAAEAKRVREAEHAAAAAEKKRLAEERAERAAERREWGAALRAAQAELREHELSRDEAAKALKSAEHAVERARTAVAAAEKRLAALAEE